MRTIEQSLNLFLVSLTSFKSDSRAYLLQPILTLYFSFLSQFIETMYRLILFPLHFVLIPTLIIHFHVSRNLSSHANENEKTIITCSAGIRDRNYSFTRFNRNRATSHAGLGNLNLFLEITRLSGPVTRTRPSERGVFDVLVHGYKPDTRQPGPTWTENRSHTLMRPAGCKFLFLLAVCARANV